MFVVLCTCTLIVGYWIIYLSLIVYLTGSEYCMYVIEPYVADQNNIFFLYVSYSNQEG